MGEAGGEGPVGGAKRRSAERKRSGEGASSQFGGPETMSAENFEILHANLYILVLLGLVSTRQQCRCIVKCEPSTTVPV